MSRSAPRHESRGCARRSTRREGKGRCRYGHQSASLHLYAIHALGHQVSRSGTRSRSACSTPTRGFGCRPPAPPPSPGRSLHAHPHHAHHGRGASTTRLVDDHCSPPQLYHIRPRRLRCEAGACSRQADPRRLAWCRRAPTTSIPRVHDHVGLGAKRALTKTVRREEAEEAALVVMEEKLQRARIASVKWQ